MISVFLDESGTHDGARLLTVAAAVSRATAWDAFEKRWKPRLKRSGLDSFHAKDRRSWPLREPLAQEIEKISTVGFSASVDPAVFKRAAGPNLRSTLGNAYALCTFALALRVADWSRDQKLGAIFYALEDGQPNAEFVGRVLRLMMKDRHFRVAGVAVVTKAEFCQLQVADFLAHSTSTGNTWRARLKRAFDHHGELVEDALTEQQLLNVSAEIRQRDRHRRAERRGQARPKR